MNRYEKEIKAIEEAMFNHAKSIESLYAKEADEDRKLTDDERLEVETHTKAITTLKAEKAECEANLKTLDEVKDISRKLGPAIPEGSENVGVSFENGFGVKPGGDRIDRAVKSLGEQFTDSPGFKSVHEQWTTGGRQHFSTGAVNLSLKGTLFEGTAGSGQGLIPVPQVIPGQVQKLFQPLKVENLLLSGQAGSNSLRYVVEGTATSAAAGVAEGGTKPESTLGLSTVDEPIKKVATTLTVSDEMLEDVQQVQAYINGRLSLFVEIEVERELVSGSQTNEVSGLTNRAINAYARGTVDNNAVAIFKAMNGQRGSAFLEPDFIVMNPANWQSTRLLTDGQGQFFGGGPFMGPYGNATQIGNSSQLEGPQDYLWGKPVVVTTAVGAGTALIGTTSAAQVWSRGGLSVEATNSHSTFFVNNLVSIRAERRLGLAVYRPAAFTTVTGLS